MTKNFNVENKKEKCRNKGTNKQQQPDFDKYDTSAHLSTCVPSFNLLGLTIPKKSVTKNFNIENWKERKMKK